MKIAIRGGHNNGVTGASGILDEVTEDRKIYIKVIEYLKQLGHQVLDATSSNTSTTVQDLSYGVTKANDWGADYFFSIHLNSGGGKGTEVLYYNGSSKGKDMAIKIVNKISALGFVNRGAKIDTRGLYELRNTGMAANIVEVCFVDSKEDAELYKKVGIDRIAKAIAEGITGQEIEEKAKSKFPLPLKVTNNVVSIGFKNGQPYPVKEFRIGDLITAIGEINKLYELNVNGEKAYIPVGYTANR